MKASIATGPIMQFQFIQIEITLNFVITVNFLMRNTQHQHIIKELSRVAHQKHLCPDTIPERKLL